MDQKAPLNQVAQGSTDPGRSKVEQLQQFRVDNDKTTLTTNQGVPIADNQNSLKAGQRGPTLLEDFIMREKITHFDHERIPERVVHARGEAAHGFFQVYESMAPWTCARFLQDPSLKTPVFVRFSTVGGSRGSADTVRDARGFAVKFYTDEGNYDLVGNNIPVFFIQDAIKFPDLVHALKPEPHNEMPQASSAHDTFWDFINNTPESLHMVLWVMSDRAIPRSLRMMEGFGVHTFRFVNADGRAHFVKFHWKPLLGSHALSWDEAQRLAGKDPDFHRRDLWEAIEHGHYPEWELGVQLIEEGDELAFDFDLLDPTKLVPEELVPVRRIGKLTLNRNPDNFFAETEQVAFHPGHVVPGIDFSHDPLLQGRLFSYTDTQLLRLGGPNFHQLPINRPLCPFHNNQRDGLGQQQIHSSRVAYDRNTLANGYPVEASPQHGGYVSHPQHIDAPKLRHRSESFANHYTQAALFWNSQTAAEQDHIVAAFHFELSKVAVPSLREGIVSHLSLVDSVLAERVAFGVGVRIKVAEKNQPLHNFSVLRSPALSMSHGSYQGIATRKVAVLLVDGVDGSAIARVKAALEEADATVTLLSARLGSVQSVAGTPLKVDHTLATMPSLMFDAVFIPDGSYSVSTLLANGELAHFVLEAWKHGKAVATLGQGLLLLKALRLDATHTPELGLISAEGSFVRQDFIDSFIGAIAQHRFWNRPDAASIAA